MAEQWEPEQNDGHFPEVVESGLPNALTGIPPAYTLATHGSDTNEADKLMVKNFLNTLAEIAVSVASRKVSE